MPVPHMRFPWAADLDSNYEARRYGLLTERRFCCATSIPPCGRYQDIAAKTMFAGIAKGWFTGKKTAYYIDGEKANYVSASRIINARMAPRRLQDRVG